MSTASFTEFGDAEVCLTFGKHRGQPLSEIETSYLEWAKNADRMSPDLRAAIERELASRAPKDPDHWRVAKGLNDATLEYARLIIESGRQELEAAMDDYQIAAAAEFLKACLAQAALDADPGTLPF